MSMQSIDIKKTGIFFPPLFERGRREGSWTCGLRLGFPPRVASLILMDALSFLLFFIFFYFNNID